MSKPLTEEETKLVAAAMGLPPKPESGKTPGDHAREARGEAEAALRNADRAARRNDLAGAKKWTDAAKRQAEIAAQLANAPLPDPSWEEELAMRDELMERLTKLAEADNGLSRWRMRLEIWEEMAAEARRTGAPMPPPMPPRPPHWSDTLPEELRKRVDDEM